MIVEKKKSCLWHATDKVRGIGSAGDTRRAAIENLQYAINLWDSIPELKEWSDHRKKLTG